MSSFDFEGRITDIVDYPKPGVVFKDITTLLKDPDGFEATSMPLPSTLRMRA